MTAVLDALEALAQSLDHLEAAAVVALEREKALEGKMKKAQKAPQHDLFNPLPQKKTGAASSAAKKLDVMIERVEKILAEG